MEVKVGVLHTAREIVVDSAQSLEEVEKAVATALKDVDGRLELTDERGRKIIVPGNLVAYVDIAEPEVRRVGFVTD